MSSFSSAPAPQQQKPVSGDPTDDPNNPFAAAYAKSMLQSGMSSAPAGSWTEGMARIAQAMMGGYQTQQLMKQAQQQPTLGVPVASPIQPGSYGPPMGAIFGTGDLY